MEARAVVLPLTKSKSVAPYHTLQVVPEVKEDQVQRKALLASAYWTNNPRRFPVVVVPNFKLAILVTEELALLYPAITNPGSPTVKEQVMAV